MTVPDEIATLQLRKLYGWWCAHRTEAKLPSRRQIDPLDLKFLLENLLIIDVSYNRFDSAFVYSAANLPRG
jgi:hypothetical protein